MMEVVCYHCDGLGHDDDMLCPMPCDYCNGTGFELDEPDDEYDPPCTGCDDTGIAHQTERACSCEAGDAYR